VRILVVEDNPTTDSLTASLKATGVSVEQVDNGNDALSLVRHYDFDVAVVDLMLPESRMQDLIRRMRAARVEVPLLLFSSQGCQNAGHVDRQAYYNGVKEQLRAIATASKTHSERILRIGGLKANLDTGEVFLADKPVRLSRKEFATLELLMVRRGRVVTRVYFMSYLYAGLEEPDIKIVDVFIYTLRRKLAQAGHDDLIGTVPGRGYIMRDRAGERAETAGDRFAGYGAVPPATRA